MRILIVGNAANTPVKTIATLLRSEGHDVDTHQCRQPSRSAVTRLRGSLGLCNDRSVLREMIARFRPDFMHVMGEPAYSAPPLLMEARRAGVRTIWSVTDFAPLCPAGSCRTPQGSVCEECMHGTPRVMIHKCLSQKTLDSFVGLIDTLCWDVRRLAKVADDVAVTSDFMRSKWLEAGFPSQRVHTITPPCLDAGTEVCDRRDGTFCYIGPLTAESGVETLVRAALSAEVRLNVYGDGPLHDRIASLSGRTPLITLAAEAPAGALAKAKAAVIPAESYLCGEAQVKQSLWCGTPVISSAIAALPQMVGPADGVTFTPGNTEELTAVLREFDKRHAFSHRDIARRSRITYSEHTYFKKLMKLYHGC